MPLTKSEKVKLRTCIADREITKIENAYKSWGDDVIHFFRNLEPEFFKKLLLCLSANGKLRIIKAIMDDDDLSIPTDWIPDLKGQAARNGHPLTRHYWDSLECVPEGNKYETQAVIEVAASIRAMGSSTVTVPLAGGHQSAIATAITAAIADSHFPDAVCSPHAQNTVSLATGVLWQINRGEKRFFCSGVLVASNIFITAGHCQLGSASYQLSFFYQSTVCQSSAMAGAGAGGAKFDEREAGGMRLLHTGYANQLDYAVFQLDNPVFDITPAVCDFTAPSIDIPVLLIHHPGGAPKKITAGKVLSASSSTIKHSAETFKGSSGAPIVAQASGHVLGLNISGAPGSYIDADTKRGGPQINNGISMQRILSDYPALSKLIRTAPTNVASLTDRVAGVSLGGGGAARPVTGQYAPGSRVFEAAATRPGSAVDLLRGRSGTGLG